MKKYSFAADCVKELQAEYEATKKCLERMPWELFDYKPHPRSMNMGYLALLVGRNTQVDIVYHRKGRY